MTLENHFPRLLLLVDMGTMGCLFMSSVCGWKKIGNRGAIMHSLNKCTFHACLVAPAYPPGYWLRTDLTTNLLWTNLDGSCDSAACLEHLWDPKWSWLYLLMSEHLTMQNHYHATDSLTGYIFPPQSPAVINRFDFCSLARRNYATWSMGAYSNTCLKITT